MVVGHQLMSVYFYVLFSRQHSILDPATMRRSVAEIIERMDYSSNVRQLFLLLWLSMPSDLHLHLLFHVHLHML